LQKLARKLSFIPIFLLSFAFASESILTAKTPKEGVLYSDAIGYLNDIRFQVGLNALVVNPNLLASAQNHANYCAANDIITHDEISSKSNFTGENPSARAFAAGYNSQILENVSSGQEDEISSVNGLMSAIYHRFGFLNLHIDEFGFATAKNETTKFYVFNMGNSKIEGFCKAGASEDGGFGEFYRGMCKNPQQSISARNLANKSYISPRKFVAYPVGENVAATFSNEIPDPMPECKITANPVSIEFSKFDEKVMIRDFEIFEGSRKLTNTVLLNKKTDPNRLLNEFQFALFSKEIFKFDTEYRVKFSYFQGREEKFEEWSFTTATPKRPYFEVRGGEILGIEADKEYEIFVIPKDCNDVVESWSFSYSPITGKPEIETVETNLLRIKANGFKGSSLKLAFSDGKEITLKLQTTSKEAFKNIPKSTYICLILGIIAIVFGIFKIIFRHKGN